MQEPYRRKTISAVLAEMQATQDERSRTYGNGNEMHARVLQALFPKGVDFKDPAIVNKFLLLNFIIAKTVRYANRLQDGGHKDSIHDIGIYAALLETYHD